MQGAPPLGVGDCSGWNDFMPGRLRRHDEPGHVHFVTVSTFRRLQFFAYPSVCAAFVEGLSQIRMTHPIRWLGYVVMPEHVHIAVLPQRSSDRPPVPISLILQELKSWTGRWCKDALRGVWRERHSLGTPKLDAWATAEGEKPFWKPRGYDFNIDRKESLLQKLDYIHRNPLRRGLVERAEDWTWSSYRYYEFGDPVPIAMDWDGGFPLL